MSEDLRELPPLPGWCRCGQRLPIGGWMRRECPRCAGRGGVVSATDDPPPWYQERDEPAALGDVLGGALTFVLVVLAVGMLVYLLGE